MELFSSASTAVYADGRDAATAVRGRSRSSNNNNTGRKASSSASTDEAAQRNTGKPKAKSAKVQSRGDDGIHSEEEEEDDDDDEEPEEVVTLASLAASSASNTTFASLGLVPWLQQATAAMGFRFPTDIQRACVEPILRGRDVLGCAETGSGKTAGECKCRCRCMLLFYVLCCAALCCAVLSLV